MIICNIGFANGPITQAMTFVMSYVIEALMVIVYGIMWISFAYRRSKKRNNL
jgi:hypothetical protein